MKLGVLYDSLIGFPNTLIVVGVVAVMVAEWGTRGSVNTFTHTINTHSGSETLYDKSRDVFLIKPTQKTRD